MVIPKPWAVAGSFGQAWRQGLGGDIVASVEEAAGGWFLGVAGALAIGVPLGRLRWLKGIVNPVIEVIRPVSALVWVPLAIVWFGIGYSSKLFIIALATFLVVVVHVIQGVAAADPRHLKVARMLSMRRRQVYRDIILPSAVPEIMTGFRVGLAIAWGAVIIAELVAGNTGVGAMEILAQEGGDMNLVVVGMIVFAALGLITVLVFGFAERLAFPWLVAQRRGSIGLTAPFLVSQASANEGGRLVRMASALGGLVLLVAVWWIAAVALHTKSVVLPTPKVVGTTLGHLLTRSSFLLDIRASFFEFLIGYALAILTAFLVASVFVAVPFIHRSFWPQVELLRFVIPFSWIPLAILWFSLSSTGKVFIVWYAVFFTVIVSFYNALAGVDVVLLKVGRMLRLSAWQQLFQIRLRSALPGLAAGARVGVAIGWISVIAAEYLGAVHGLGIFITNAQDALDTQDVLAGMVIIGIMGVVMSTLITTISRFSVSNRRSKAAR